MIFHCKPLVGRKKRFMANIPGAISIIPGVYGPTKEYFGVPLEYGGTVLILGSWGTIRVNGSFKNAAKALFLHTYDVYMRHPRFWKLDNENDCCNFNALLVNSKLEILPGHTKKKYLYHFYNIQKHYDELRKTMMIFS